MFIRGIILVFRNMSFDAGDGNVRRWIKRIEEGESLEMEEARQRGGAVESKEKG